MGKAYVVVTEAVHDKEGMEAYGKAALPSILAGGAKVLAVDTNVEAVEGEWHGTQTVLLEFESAEAAKAWYDGPGYADAKPLRHAAADSNAAIIHGF